MIMPERSAVGDGLLKVVSTGFLVDEDTALMWRGLMLTEGGRAVPRATSRGANSTTCSSTCRPAPATCRWAWPACCRAPSMIVVTTPAIAAQKVAQRAADMAQRSFLQVVGVIENMSAFTCDHGETYALFGEGGGQALAAEIGAPLLGQVPLEPRSPRGGDAGEPVALAGEGAAADVFRSIADRILTEIAPPATGEPVDMAGCSARLLDAGRGCVRRPDLTRRSAPRRARC